MKKRMTDEFPFADIFDDVVNVDMHARMHYMQSRCFISNGNTTTGISSAVKGLSVHL